MASGPGNSDDGHSWTLGLAGFFGLGFGSGSDGHGVRAGAVSTDIQLRAVGQHASLAHETSEDDEEEEQPLLGAVGSGNRSFDGRLVGGSARTSVLFAAAAGETEKATQIGHDKLADPVPGAGPAM